MAIIRGNEFQIIPLYSYYNIFSGVTAIYCGDYLQLFCIYFK
ncbi:Uncharacterised protein [Yersinia enterocolitica]|nr:Uncharacterised protein [Yersinia enterocolitica]